MKDIDAPFVTMKNSPQAIEQGIFVNHATKYLM